MDYIGLWNTMFAIAKKKPDIAVCRDLSDLIVNWAKAEPANNTPYKLASTTLNLESHVMRYYAEKNKFQEADQVRDLIYRTLKFSAPKNFDHYMQCMEFNRAPEERFYLPRRKVLFGHVQALQKAADREINELFLSQPPRTGKTSLVTFFYTWEFGRNPERSNLYVSYSDALTNAFYGGLLEVMEDSHTYNWQEIFPTQQIVNKNAKNETLDVGRVKKYPTMTCRSLFGTLNGSTNCDNILVADDLLSGIEEALNPDRLLKTWMTVENNMLSRAKMQACVIWIGTRWSVADPMGRRIDALQHDPKFRKIIKYKVINIPALNSKDESNFEYDYNVGFSTDYYRAKRASFEAANDLVSWSAQYMGTPIEREGTLFKPDNMKYFNGVLPEGEPDRVFCAVDPAFGGGDFTAAPIVYQYKDEFYVVDVIYSDQNKRFTQPLIAKKAQKHGITAMRIEATKATQPYVQGVQEEMDKLGYHLTIQTKSAPPNTSKEQRIFDKSADIMSYFLFLDMSHRSNDYNLFMQNVFSFKLTGRNKHDDAPDSLAMTCEMAFERSLFKARAFRRPC